ncbi:MAG: hypothetical protein M3Y77_18110 [Actinomycetota bacterium]|nr:hypothetical protein [Actinomycetota bacterium]
MPVLAVTVLVTGWLQVAGPPHELTAAQMTLLGHKTSRRLSDAGPGTRPAGARKAE